MLGDEKGLPPSGGKGEPMTKRTMIQRSAPRVCTARQVAAFDKQAVLDRLFAGEGVESDF